MIKIAERGSKASMAVMLASGVVYQDNWMRLRRDEMRGVVRA